MNILICFCNMMVSTLHQVLCNSDTLQLCSQCTAHQFSPTPEVQMQMCSECTAYGECYLLSASVYVPRTDSGLHTEVSQQHLIDNTFDIYRVSPVNCYVNFRQSFVLKAAGMYIYWFCLEISTICSKLSKWCQHLHSLYYVLFLACCQSQCHLCWFSVILEYNYSTKTSAPYVGTCYWFNFALWWKLFFFLNFFIMFKLALTWQYSVPCQS